MSQVLRRLDCQSDRSVEWQPQLGAQLGMKRHNLQPAFRESSDSLRQQAASTNLPMPSSTASGNGVYALALGATSLHVAVAKVGGQCLPIVSLYPDPVLAPSTVPNRLEVPRRGKPPVSVSRSPCRIPSAV